VTLLKPVVKRGTERACCQFGHTPTHIADHDPCHRDQTDPPSLSAPFLQPVDVRVHLDPVPLGDQKLAALFGIWTPLDGGFASGSSGCGWKRHVDRHRRRRRRSPVRGVFRVICVGGVGRVSGSGQVRRCDFRDGWWQ